MAKAKGYTTLLVIALVTPILGANFLMSLINLIMQKAFTLTATLNTVAQNLNLYLPLVLFLVGLAFSIIVLVSDKKESKVLPVTALVLNSILIVSGILSIVLTYLEV